MDSYEKLANAIVLQAVKDYRTALKRVARHPKDRDGLATKNECAVLPFRLVRYSDGDRPGDADEKIADGGTVIMTTKQYLKQTRYLDERINTKIAQVSSLHNLATKATSTLSDMP